VVALILTTIVGLVFAYLATQNTVRVDLNLSGYVLNIPIYLVALGSLLIGFLISSIVSIIDSISAFFTIHDKDHKIRVGQRTVGQLEDRIQQLEIENAQLKGQKGEQVNSQKAIEKEHHPRLIDRLRHNLSTR